MIDGPVQTILDPGHPNLQLVGNKFIVKDLWETREEFKTAIGGLEFSVWYTKSHPSKTRPDQIELHFQKILTNQEKKAIETAYADMIIRV